MQWFPDISKALKTKLDLDKAHEIDFVKNTKKYKVIPLLIASSILTLLILPEMIKIFWHSLIIIKKYSYKAFAYYDIVLSIILYIECLSIILSIYLINSFIKIQKELQSLR